MRHPEKLPALVVFTLAASLFAGDSRNPKAAEPGTGLGVGIGFLWTQQSQAVAAKLTSEKDFVDVILGPGKLDVFEQVQLPVRVACIARALEKNDARPFPGVKETIETLREAGIAPERVIIAYNPERSPGTPTREIDDLVASEQQARQLTQPYGAPLLIGPGLREMEQREHLYPELAKLCDIWMIQSQRLQIDPITRKPVDPAEYRAKVKHIVDLLHEGDPNVGVFVQLVTTAERGTSALTADQIVAYVRQIEDLADAVRIYGGSAELLSRIIEQLRAPVVKALSLPAMPAKQTIMIPMRDGAALATDLYMPADFSAEIHLDGVPVILVCTPYDRTKEGPIGRWRDCFLGNGYAFAVQDMRGFYGSAAAGRGASRHDDGCDTIEWLAKQPWCSGKVGMLGYSHLGAAQYEAAVTAPPHLACTIPAQAPANYYTDSYYPPKFRKADMETILRGPLTSRTSQLIRRRIRSRDTNSVPQFNTPMLHSAGWYDFYTEGAVEMFRACQQDAGPGARGKQKLLIGPWGHGVLQEEDPGTPLLLPGDLAYPPNSKLDWEHNVWLPWFDYWLKGKPTGVMDRPAVMYYLMGDVDNADAPGNVWVEANDFPPPSEAVPYYAHSDHTLRVDPPTAQNESLEYRYDPRDPVPTVGRFHSQIPVKGPYDQREVEGRADVLVFTTAALETPLKIVGQIRVKLWASSDRQDTDFTAKLTEVHSDGRSMMISDSIVKGRYRNTYLKEEFLRVGQVYEFEIDLGYTAIVLAPGHRLRLAISSSNFDRFDINPNTGDPYGDHAATRQLLSERLRAEPSPGEPQYIETLIATNAIYMDRDHPTHVILPVVVGND